VKLHCVLGVYNGAQTWEMSVGQHVEQNSQGLPRGAIGFWRDLGDKIR
jgi:hypothetical protein